MHQGVDLHDLPRCPVADEEVVHQLHRPLVLDHRDGGTARRFDPPRELLGVRHGGRQAHEAHRRGRVHQDLLPHRPAVAVLEVVDLVEDHPAELGKRPRPRVDHVAEHLGGHHDDRSVRTDGVVAREQPHLVGAEAMAQVGELLVGERLDRGGVEGSSPAGQRAIDRVVGHHGLACPRRRRDQHVAVGVDGRVGLALEPVELEGGLAHADADARRPTISRPIKIDTS
ncbi:MAG: hypothetical protein R2701_05820 [Acidimicrobiales bacterium]